MKRIGTLLSVAWLWALVASDAPAGGGVGASQSLVALEFVDERGGAFETYAAASEAPDVYRAFLEAEPEALYRIRARNLSGTRIGIVIAVDGRNIISGERSELGRGEPMYILDPYQTVTYAGWRTSEAEVRRFYFTSLEHSYASRIGDESAIGVVAAAVFRPKPESIARWRQSPGRPAAPSVTAESSDAASGQAEARSQAGTGFGESEKSRVVRVSFSPERQPSQRSFFKYEWPAQLCARGVKVCSPANRFWPEQRHGFVPLPPGERG